MGFLLVDLQGGTRVSKHAIEALRGWARPRRACETSCLKKGHESGDALEDQKLLALDGQNVPR